MELTHAPRGSQRTAIPRSTAAIVAASVLGGALTLCIAAWRLPLPVHLDRAQIAVTAGMGGLWLVSWVRPIVAYRGMESSAFNLDEGIFVILALLVPPVAALGTLAIDSQHYRNLAAAVERHLQILLAYAIRC